MLTRMGRLGVYTVLAAALALGVLGMGGASVASAQGAETFQFVREVAQAAIQATLKATKLTEAELLQEVFSGKTLAQVITDKGADVEAVKAEAKTAVSAKITDALSKGTLTQTQADQFNRQLDNALNRLFGGRDAPLQLARTAARVMVDMARRVLQFTAEATKLTQAEVLRELASGKTPAALITEKGAKVEDVAKAIKDDATKAIEEAVTGGRITRQQADQLLAGLDAQINTALNSPFQPAARAGNVPNPALRLLEGQTTTVLIAETAKQTDLSQRDLLARLREGKSLREIATEAKADPEKIIAEAQKTLETRIDLLARTNRINAEQVQQYKQALPDMLRTTMDNKNLLQRGLPPRR